MTGSRAQARWHGNERLREKIKCEELIDHLQNKILNNQPITSNEVGAAKLLMDRALSTLANLQIQQDLTHTVRRIDICVGRGRDVGLEAPPAGNIIEYAPVQCASGTSEVREDVSGGGGPTESEPAVQAAEPEGALLFPDLLPIEADSVGPGEAVDPAPEPDSQ